MSKAAEAGLMNAEMVLRFREGDLKKAIEKLTKEQAKETKELLKLMKTGDEDLINGQASLVASLQGTIRDLTRSKQRLHIFAAKIKSARLNQSIGTSMVAVSRALGRVTKNIELERVEAVMADLGRQYEDIDVMTQVLDSATATGSASTASPEDVEKVKRQVADAAGVEMGRELEGGRVPTTKVGPTAEEEEASSERLKSLRQGA
ncbi:Inherit from dotNOG: Snf7 [Pseudogymnoascus destructans]|uniref:Inherit from dotNOG: Snf7 n=1 Tax=Pseudogymnoascus destructans TaxID=655981 RepID=A0A177A8W0_9PEZI|nr:Inherit from dotNOG: Snf7 [Pseudogymnoascus destructans]OAF58576.1 Inherit from dotNOG: Snf7 [Pseudogymnoascus destructans]